MTLFKTLAATPRLLLRSDPTAYYQFLGDDLLEGKSEKFRNPNKPMWLNLGYWRGAKTHTEAASAMARLLGDAIELQPRDNLLDVGFGFAEQDFQWLNEYGVAHITGVNITAMQVERARARAKERNLDDRLHLGLGSATALPFAPASFTKLSALECAFHFVTREHFLAEAFRLLVPGGRLGLCDGLPLPGTSLNLFSKIVLRRWGVPVENFYDRDVYAEKLKALGFINVKVQSISEHVFPGFVRYSDLRTRGATEEEAVVSLAPEDIEPGIKAWSKLGLNDYVLVTADKP